MKAAIQIHFPLARTIRTSKREILDSTISCSCASMVRTRVDFSCSSIRAGYRQCVVVRLTLRDSLLQDWMHGGCLGRGRPEKVVEKPHVFSFLATICPQMRWHREA